MKRTSIRLRLAAWYCAVLLFGLSLFGFAMWYALQLRLVAGVDQRLAQRVAGLKTALGSESGIHSEEQFRRELAEFTSEVPDVALVQLGGSAGDSPEGAYRTVQSAGKSYRVTVAHLVTAGRPFVLSVQAPLDDVQAVMHVFRYLLLLMVPAVLVVAALGGYWLSSRALRPVGQITTAAESIGVQDLSQRIEAPHTGDELQRMAEVWNAMLARLEASVERIRQFTADASHELRTPLALIRTTAELALRRDRSAEEYRQSLRDVLGEVAHMTSLTESLLSLARSDAKGAGMKFAPADLGELVRSVLDEYARLASEKGLLLKGNQNAQPVIANVDAPAIRRVLLILLDNAVRHTPGGGVITLSASHEGQAAVLSVEDTGEGIAPEALPCIFDRFYRADPARGGGAGFGLGLSIAQAIAQAHGTEIHAASSPGAGARFWLKLNV